MTRIHVLIIAVLVGLIALLWSAIVRAHDPYSLWQRPDGGGSCCSGNADTGDFGPVRAQIGDDGLWRALTPDGWIIVPNDKVLPFAAPDGNAHLCAIGPHIYCFAAPVPKS